MLNAQFRAILNGRSGNALPSLPARERLLAGEGQSNETELHDTGRFGMEIHRQQSSPDPKAGIHLDAFGVLQARSARRVLLADSAAPFADERLVPLSVLPLVCRMIVLPEDSHDENEGRRREDRIE